ncbi:hypothetical protein GJ496_009429 [Pomphorhynchus laevis]|nr:hypothetical protein GJ496_009429 [Pomphorhynchus laevis]
MKKPVKSDKVKCTDKSTYFTELVDATSVLNSPIHNRPDPSGSISNFNARCSSRVFIQNHTPSYVERLCDQPASSDIGSMPKHESFLDNSEKQHLSIPINYISNATLEQKCDKLDLQQHTGCNKRGACKGRLINFDSRIKTLFTIPEISGFAVASTNARSMLSKFDEVREWVLSSSFDIIEISETWSHSDIPRCIVQISG